MFQKRDQKRTVIGEGTVIIGQIEVSGELQIDGVVDGTIKATGPVAIGPSGVLQGELRGTEVSVAGRIEGAVIVDGALRMLASGVIQGEAVYQSLQVDQGGVINGSTTRSEAPPPLDIALVPVEDAS
ncbi:MAG: polymer-forming cytoskeletal protein [Myxococcales bacterium]|nr:MAG: polymer-forming cytoskeletal protein [Myxococcales bacterium]